MGSGWPARLLVDSHQLTVLRAVLTAAAPQEGCALLLGEPARAGAVGGVWTDARVHAIWPCLNVWLPEAERCRRFAIDPREQLQAQKWGRARGWQVLGTAHSHPRSAAVPSATDCSWAFPPALMLILGSSLELRAWQIDDGGLTASALETPSPRQIRELELHSLERSPAVGGEDLGE
jgi:proteasome lid subunit RPN8/RPN11